METDIIHIIHLPDRPDRLHLLMKELYIQHITSYLIWEGFRDIEKPCRGIAKAHKQIISWAKDQSLPAVVIVEDDIKFTAPGAFQYYLKNEPAEYDLYLGGILYGQLKDDNSVDDFAGTHLYKISHRFYNTFLSLPGENDIDRAMSKKGKFLVCNPFVAIQHDGFSDNKKEFCKYEPYLKERKLFDGQ